MFLLAEWSWAAPELPVDNWWFFIAVLVVLIVFIALIARLAAAAGEEIDPAEIDRQMLTAVNDLHTEGELTPEEYRSIKSRLVDRLSEQNQTSDSDDSSAQVVEEKESEGQQQPATEEQSVRMDPESEDEPVSDSPDKQNNS